MASDLESQMVAVERIKVYANMPQEASHFIPENDPSSDWPHSGGIDFERVKMSYRPGLPLVLNSLSMTIYPGEKIGIVGRTGAGKSSLVVALLRLVELESGRIMIDDEDISLLGLNRLRKAIAVIPQVSQY